MKKDATTLSRLYVFYNFITHIHIHTRATHTATYNCHLQLPPVRQQHVFAVRPSGRVESATSEFRAVTFFATSLSCKITLPYGRHISRIYVSYIYICGFLLYYLWLCFFIFFFTVVVCILYSLLLIAFASSCHRSWPSRLCCIDCSRCCCVCCCMTFWHNT